MTPPRAPRLPNRRALLIGGGVGAGLLLAWGLWPRSYAANVAIAPGETLLGAFLKIGTDGRVTAIVPQAEMGQGVWTALPQALADELGADWRQIAVEPAPLSPLYANRLLAGEAGEDAVPAFMTGIGGWAAREWATRNAFMITAGSSSIRAFEQSFREAGASARALLCMAAGKRLGADWRACDTENGLVVRGEDRLRFGDLAAEAAGFAPPDPLPLRKPGAGGISGKPMPRIDLPSKIDGSARFAGDVRLPNMAYASIRHGPVGDTKLAGYDRAAADRQTGAIGLVQGPGWVAAIGENWWAADQALNRSRPRFATAGALPDEASVAKALDTALAGKGTRLIEIGDAEAALNGPGPIEARYSVPFAAHAPIEPLVATARMTGDRIELWAPTQAPGLTRAAVAAACDVAPGRVTVYPMPVGGSFGRKIENDASVEAAILALKTGRPIQLMWGRAEETAQARNRPPAKAHLSARLGEGGRIAAWRARIATPSAMAALGQRLTGHGNPDKAEAAAIEGARPPYAIPVLTMDHHVAQIGIATGMWRSVAHSYSAFFGESFMDELAAAAGQDALSFRMGLLGGEPRLARCLQRAAAAGGWSGEAGSGQGLAAHSAFGSHIAILAEAGVEGGAITVARLVAAVDCGRMINPDIVRQQIEGALVWGLAATLGDRVSYARGLPEQRGFGDLKLPRLADMPEIEIELIDSSEAPGGVAELGVPPVAPAIANAVVSASGKRLRTLPLAVA